MDLIQIITIAIIQGLTEFLPISSSGHLVLIPVITGWQDQGLALDVATHVGTLFAVLVYFYHDIVKIVGSGVGSMLGKKIDYDARRFYMLALATIPVGVVGLLSSAYIESNLRSVLVFALTSIIFGLLLYWADVKGSKVREETEITFKDALFIGLMQILALIPGASRSGVTMTAGLFLGLSRKASAKFSFLLAIPVILLAGIHEFYKLLARPETADWGAIVIATVIAAIVAFLCIHYFLKLIDKIGMLPFVIYRIVLGVILLLVFTVVGSNGPQL